MLFLSFVACKSLLFIQKLAINVSFPCVQAQYVFIHDSLSELVVCGETEVAAANFRIKMTQLQIPVAGDAHGTTGFQKQFEVHYLYSTSLNFNVFCGLQT